MAYNWLIGPLILSLKVLAVATILNLTFGILISFFLAFSKAKIKFIIEAIVTLPLIFPPMATGFLLLYILGRNGILGRYMGDFSFIFDFKGLVLAAFISGLPLFVKPLQSALETFPKNLIEAAQACGRSNFNLSLTVVLPNTKNILLTSTFISGARAIGEVGISLLLGGNIIGKTDTISLAIYNAVFDGENEKALILSLVLICLSLSLFFIMKYFAKQKEKY